MKKVLALILCSQICFSASLDIMVYNVENLFDTNHDKGKNDWTYTPKSLKLKQDACNKMRSNYRKKECLKTDWTEQKLNLKLGQISKIIKNNSGEQPDVVGLVEVENRNVVKLLARKLGYKEYLISDSPDKRGIDLAILYKENKDFKFVSKNEHIVSGSLFKKKPTRNILEAHFKLKGEDIFFFINHWPSLGNVDGARIMAANTLKEAMAKILKSKPNSHFVAMGDFNTIKKLKKSNELKIHPFSNVLLVDTGLSDLFELFKKRGLVTNKTPKGTYYYKRGRTWNHLDRVFISKNLIDKRSMGVRVNSFKIVAPEFAIKKVHGELAPYGYDHQSVDIKEVGYSDHFALNFKIDY